MSPPTCCVTLEKSGGTVSLQPLTLGTYGKVTEGHKPVPSLWAFALIDYLSYIVTLC